VQLLPHARDDVPGDRPESDNCVISGIGGTRSAIASRRLHVCSVCASVHYNSLEGGLCGRKFLGSGQGLSVFCKKPKRGAGTGTADQPVEMGLPESPVLPYSPLFGFLIRKSWRPFVWGADSFAIRWPSERRKGLRDSAPPPGTTNTRFIYSTRPALVAETLRPLALASGVSELSPR